MRFADLDAVTIDAFGTLVELVDPVPALRDALLERGIDRTDAAVREALHTEQTYYRAHLSEARDTGSLTRLRVRCTDVFLEAAEADVAADEFEPAFIASLRFRTLRGAEQALRVLRDRGLVLAVVANWDISLRELIGELGLREFFALVEPLAEKPRPDGLLRTLRTLGVDPSRALHVGDEDDDARAAAGAGTSYRPAPLADAFAGIG
jgi:HAD superfamily hydrolase (TIGR01509 family)